MANDIVMPNLGFDTQSGRLIEWLKQPGDPVRQGEAIAIVESDKADVELESVAGGTLLELLVPAGTDVPVGTVIARVGQAEERAQASQPAAAAGAAITAEVSPVARRLADEHRIDLAQVAGSGPGGRIMRGDVEALITPARHTAAQPVLARPRDVLALPKVRRAARLAGIDLTLVTPTGTHRQVTMRDLTAYQAAHSAGREAAVPQSSTAETASAADGRREITLSRARRLIGERMSRSTREAPHFYVSGEFDLEGVLPRLAAPIRINDVLQYLTVQTLLRVPALNATYEDDRLYQHEAINLAVAVAHDDLLITPVIQRAERYSLSGLAEESRALIARTREGHLRPGDLQGGTFTISNLGVVSQVERFTAVLNPPQVAILAVGAVKARPVVVSGGLHIRHTVFLTLSGDHRAVNGMHLAQFMSAFQAQLDAFVQQG